MKFEKALLPVSILLIAVGSQSAMARTVDLERERSRQMRETQERERRMQETIEKQKSNQEVIEKEEESQISPKKGGELAFEVKKIITSPSEILSADEITAIVRPLEGKKVKLQSLFDAVEAINALYKEKNYLAAKAILPPQKVKEGVVTIKLIEGRVGAIAVEDNPTTRDTYIVNRLENKPGELVQLDQLESDLFYFNRTNDVSLRAVLKPGQKPGTTDYVLQATEPEHEQGLVFIDNAGTDDVGLYRIGFSYTNNSLLGWRDRLTLGAHVAEGTKAAYASYDFPVSKKGTRLALNFDVSTIKIIDGQLQPLDVTGESSNVGIQVTHPFVVTKDLLLNGFAGLNHKTSTTDFSGVTLFDTDVDSLTLGFDAQSYDLTESWYTRHALTHGEYEDLNGGSFNKYNGEGNWLRIFESNHMLSIRGAIQYSSDELLPSSEQFQVGGMYSVRGYPEGLLKGDKGYSFSIEYDVPFPFRESGPWENPFTDKWRAFAFFDHGGAFPFKGNNAGVNDDDFLSSIGFGLGVNFDKTLRGRVVVGVPLSSRDDKHDDVRIHFYLQNIPF